MKKAALTRGDVCEMMRGMSLPEMSSENVLGPYRLLRVLGEGGMGTVYLGFDEMLDRHVAVKVLRGEMAEEWGASIGKRFLREAKSAAKLNHPHVVTILTVGRQGGAETGRPYMAMEYCAGGSLADELRREGPLEGEKAAEVIRQACLGLEAAHEAGVVHRDIKPANLLRGAGGVVKLCDFGLARVVSGAVVRDGELTHPGAFVGSPAYAAPEQVCGSSQIDGRCDLYALAATWWALLCGQPPFVGEDASEVMRRQLNDRFGDVRKTRPDVRGEWMEIIWKASEKQARDRYESAREMREAIERVQRMERGSSVGAVVLRKPEKAEGGAEKSIEALREELESARSRSDGASQISALRGLFGLYNQLDRREEAMRAYREALVLHVKEAGAQLLRNR